MKMILPLLAAGLVAGAAAEAAAGPAPSLIRKITFVGHGRVTFVQLPADDSSFIIGTPPVFGAPVTVSGAVYFGDGHGPAAPPPIPAGFTGTAHLYDDALRFHSQRFWFSVAGGGTAWDTFHDDHFESSGFVTFVNGLPTGFSLTNDDDPTVSILEPHFFETSSGYSFDDYSVWGGTWTVDKMTVSAPEPGAWALMIVGFGGVGAAVRRRRDLANSA